MAQNFEIFNRQIQASVPSYGTISVTVTSDLLPYALTTTLNSVSSTISTNINLLSSTTSTALTSLSSTVNNRITSLSGTVDSKFLPLTGGRLSGNLTLSGTDGQDKSLILFSPTVNASAELKAAITFIGFNPNTGQFEPEPGVSFPRILIREGRLDLDPDTIFTRAEFRVSNVNTQFNIYNKDLAKYYLRIRPNGGFEAGGTNLTASGANSHAEGNNSEAIGDNSHAEGSATRAIGIASHSEGVQTNAIGENSHAAGGFATAAHNRSWIWKGTTNLSISQLSTTRAGQFMVSAEGGAAFFGNVGIGTNSIANALTVVGNISGDNLSVSFNQSRATGNYSFAEGQNTAATGNFSHAEGQNTQALGPTCHAEGWGTQSGPGNEAHAEGQQTIASGNCSHSEGKMTWAQGINSHAAGSWAHALHNYSYIWSDGNLDTVNTRIPTTRSGQYMVSASGGMFIAGRVGIGTDSIANALTVVGDISATGTGTFNTVTLSSVTFTGETKTSITSVTATDTYVKVIANGQTKYLRLFDVI